MTPDVDPRESGAKTAPSALEEANAAFDAGDYARALMMFDDVISSGAGDEIVHNNRGAALEAMGILDRATESYVQATRLAPDYELAWHNLGNCMYSRGLFEEAADAYRRASKLNPSRLASLVGLANCYSRLGKVRRARSVLKRLQAAGAREPRVKLMAAEILLDMHQHLEAARLCEEHIRTRGESVEALTLLATASHEAGDFARAVSHFEKALKLAPGDKELLNNIGYSLFCAGFLELALSSFDQALAIDPDYKHAWYNKGYSLHGAERLKEAVECYERAIAIDPNDKVLWNNLGNALYNLGMFEQSIPKFVEALGVDPDYEIAWNNIGNALEKLGEWEEAIPYHERSLEIRPDFDYALYAKGVCLSMTGKPEEGYDLILESINLNPDYDEAWRARSRVARQLGRWDEALSSVEEALSVNPGFAEGWADRGDILSATGDHVEAESSYRTALAQFPPVRNGSQNESSMVRRKAEVMTRLGRFEEAVATLGEAVSTRSHHRGLLSAFIESLRLCPSVPVPQWLHAMLEDAEDAEVLLDYCELLLDRAQHDDALKVLERLPPSHGQQERVVFTEALVYARAGIPEEEVSSLLVDLSCASASRLRGELAEMRGDIPLAEAEYSKALDANPSDYASAEALARVRLRLGRHRDALEAAKIAHGIDPSEPAALVLMDEAYASSRRISEEGKP